jgi:hypothetical protein
LPERNGEPEQLILLVLNRQKHSDSEEFFWNEVGRVVARSDVRAAQDEQ